MVRVLRCCMALLCCLVTLCSTVPAARSATANWTNSNLDTWSYPMAVGPGSRALSPTFLGGVTINEQTQQFDPGTVTSPARLGTTLMAFNTSTAITPNLAAGRYQINSVTFKATWTYDNDSSKLFYQDTAVSQSAILAEAVNNNFTRQKPFELYGVGLRSGYTGYEFTSPSSGPPLVDEVTHPYTASDGGYITYPIVGSATPGSYVDVSNSVTGGYSETATCNLAVPCHTTSPFTPTPWAIGKASLATGAEIPDKTTFTFQVDLNEPGVRSYVQQSLASGALGFFLSSLHSTGEFGSGGGYPRWYTKEAVGFPYFAPAASLPQLTIDYTILPEGLPGDYNGNGTVDVADYVLWRKGGALQNQVHDPSQVTQQDYIEWRARFGNSLAGSGSGVAVESSVPEPSGIALLTFGACLLIKHRKHGRNR